MERIIGNKFLLVMVILLCLMVSFGVKIPCVSAWSLDLGNLGSLNINGYLKNETALHLHDPYEFHKIRNILNVDLEYRLSDSFKAFVQLRPIYDAVFALGHEGLGGQPQLRSDLQDNWFRNDREMPLLREAWIQYSKGPFQVRIGRQIVVWGRSDGLILLDVVNPLNTQEFILGSYADMKIPLWMVNINYWFGLENSLELLWMPTKFIPGAAAPAGSPWAFRVSDLVYGSGGVVDSILAFGGEVRTRKPGVNFQNSELGLRWKGKVKGVDYTLNYLHTWKDVMDLVPTGNWLIPPGTPFLPSGFNTQYTIKPTRLEIFGGSASYSFHRILGIEDLVIRGELAYTKSDTFVRDDNSLIVKKDHLDYLLGFDKYFPNPIPIPGATFLYLSAQILQTYMINYQTSDFKFVSAALGKVKKIDTNFTLYASTSFLNELVSPEVLTVWNVDGGVWVRPKVKVQLLNQLFVTLGVNLFWGKQTNFIGEYQAQDQVFLEVKYGF